MHSDKTGHDVNNPLGVDDDHVAQEVLVEELYSSQVVQELDGLHKLKYVK